MSAAADLRDECDAAIASVYLAVGDGKPEKVRAALRGAVPQVRDPSLQRVWKERCKVWMRLYLRGAAVWLPLARYAAKWGLPSPQHARGRASRTEREEAVDYLRKTLAEGPRATEEVRNGARRLGFTDITLRRAKRGIGVISERVGGLGAAGSWVWRLPPVARRHAGDVAVRSDSDFNNDRLDRLDDAANAEPRFRPVFYRTDAGDDGYCHAIAHNTNKRCANPPDVINRTCNDLALCYAHDGMLRAGAAFFVDPEQREWKRWT
jgi:hypothetical protein